MSILPGTKAPWFSSIGYQDEKFLDISLSDFSYSGQWLVLFFYHLDFGYISPSELLELETRRKELEMMNCKILAVSSDSVVVHEQFVSINPGFGGVHGIKFPLMEDKNSSISKMYGVKKMGAGHFYRAYFIIDSDQVVRARVVGD
jgi:peroxiredoxin (alkyl hydroperoxide reductase subunit C)